MDETLSVGHWIRRRRKALDLTQAELAAQLGCSAELLRKIEADARRPSKEIAHRLARQLQLTPHECDVFVRAVRAELPPDRLPAPIETVPRPELPRQASSAVDQPARSVPTPLTPLIGRERELSSLAALMHDGARLITLTGPGGVGKTRLALELVLRFTETNKVAFPDGCWLIELADLFDTNQVGPAIARAVGALERLDLTSEESLKLFLQHRHALLVLDNLEQLQDVAALVSDLLRAAPGLCVVSTSRARLGIAGEYVWALDPLSTAAAGTLFTTRARQARADLTLAPTDQTVVAAIIERLDGLPLAIELAAARVRLFTPQELLAQLTSAGSLSVVVGGVRTLPARQHTLRATLEWSYGLLSEAEQALLARLSVFVGGFTLAAAAAVCGFDGTTIELLEALVDHSLVQCRIDATGVTRFALLATVHEFAGEMLAASGVAEESRRRHAAYVLELTEIAEPHLQGAQQGDWRRRLRIEHGNILAALTWSQGVDGDTTIGLRIAGALLWYWKPLGYRREGLAWLEATLARCENAERRQRAKALHAAGTLSGRVGSYTQAEVQLNEALSLCRAMDDVSGMLDNLSWLCIFAREQGEFERARTLFEECLALAQQHGQSQVIAAAARGLGELARAQGDIERALAWFEQALPAAHQSGDLQEIGWVITNMGRVALAHGDTRRAGTLYAEGRAVFERAGLSDSLAWMHYEMGRVSRQRGEDAQAARQFLAALAEGHTLGLPLLIASALEGLGALRSTQRPQHAARLLGAASQIRAEIANPLTPHEQSELAPVVSQLRSTLGEPSFANAWQAGSVLASDQAIDEARGTINS
jgi:predicted ATPase/transcriptional regulator with XRE-family HTH domain